MALQEGLDTVGIISMGMYTETYEAIHPANRANVYASLGYIEDAINPLLKLAVIMYYYIRRRKDD